MLITAILSESCLNIMSIAPLDLLTGYEDPFGGFTIIYNNLVRILAETLATYNNGRFVFADFV
jgi:hypothetical protein